ncbi:probable membrane-associated kinase regulator 1 [Sesamum indicum]|uniref:Probable membrane-associated kinase regulator 1 n=1 Tax=Sesamum indicum TaxID=4182 RepID=A0A6I9U2H0_SESIN|nr:probable membrane-associated kinase regulator 1 [Sesamum indicum]
MGRRTRKDHHYPTTKSHTLPSSPTHSFSSSSSSDFEFTISISPRKSSAALCPADELFYKGQLLPLHLSSRLSMVRTLLSSSSTSSSSDTTTTASRDSTASHSSSDSSSSSAADLLHHLDCDSSRPSSVTDDEFKRLTNASDNDILSLNYHHPRKSAKYFSLAKLSSVFRKENKNATPPSAYSAGGAAVKRVSSSAKEVIRKYLKKVKPLYEKLSQKQQQQQKMSCPPQSSSRISRSANTTLCLTKDKDEEFTTGVNYPKENTNTSISHSFSGNLRYPRRRSCISSCPSSMMSSPSHGKSGFGFAQMGRAGAGVYNSDASSMEELQSAIQGAIAHCKNSMLKNKNMVSNEI